MDSYTKGTRVRVHLFQANLAASLAGNQPKFAATRFVFDGTIRHIRGDARKAEDCLDIRIWVQPDEPIPEGLKTEACDRCGCLEVGGLHPDTISKIPEPKV